eukprot:PhF_6_TR9464/c0_g1_i1/m.14784/K12861/BCAS2; pre-mRNA-splicing factor SPF27
MSSQCIDLLPYAETAPAPQLLQYAKQLLQSEYDLLLSKGEVDIQPSAAGPLPDTLPRFKPMNEGNNDCQLLESELIRFRNLDMLHEYGRPAWAQSNRELEHNLALVRRETEEVENEIKEVNAKRKREQLEGMEEIRRVTDQTQSLIDKCVLMRQALSSH